MFQVTKTNSKKISSQNWCNLRKTYARCLMIALIHWIVRLINQAGLGTNVISSYAPSQRVNPTLPVNCIITLIKYINFPQTTVLLNYITPTTTN